jgi:hypothetical protein
LKLCFKTHQQEAELPSILSQAGAWDKDKTNNQFIKRLIAAMCYIFKRNKPKRYENKNHFTKTIINYQLSVLNFKRG